MQDSLSYSFDPNSEDHIDFQDYTLDGLIRYMGEKVGWCEIAMWLSGNTDMTADEILSDYEGGLQSWWGLGSVFCCELGLKVRVEFEDRKCTITVE